MQTRVPSPWIVFFFWFGLYPSRWSAAPHSGSCPPSFLGVLSRHVAHSWQKHTPANVSLQQVRSPIMSMTVGKSKRNACHPRIKVKMQHVQERGFSIHYMSGSRFIPLRSTCCYLSLHIYLFIYFAWFCRRCTPTAPTPPISPLPATLPAGATD